MARLVDQTPVTSPHSRIRLTGTDIQVAPTPTEHARTKESYQSSRLIATTQAARAFHCGSFISR
jgi:hypothetical protein